MGPHPFFISKASDGLANTPRALVEDKVNQDGGWGKGRSKSETSDGEPTWGKSGRLLNLRVGVQNCTPKFGHESTIWDRIWEMKSITTSLSCVRVGETKRGEEPPRAPPP